MYQKLNNCTLRGDFSVTSFDTLCPENPTAGPYDLDIYAVFTVMAIYATGYGLQKYQSLYCKDIDLLSCLRKTRLMGNKDLMNLKNTLIEIQLYDNDKGEGIRDFSPFDINGDGNAGYTVKTLRPTSLTASKYELVVTYTFEPDGDTVSIKPQQAVNFYEGYSGSYKDLTRPIVNLCSSCECRNQSITPEPTGVSPEATAMYVVIALLLVMLIILIVFIVFKTIREFFSFYSLNTLLL